MKKRLLIPMILTVVACVMAGCNIKPGTKAGSQQGTESNSKTESDSHTNSESIEELQIITDNLEQKEETVVQGIELPLETAIADYDVTNDGKADTIRIHCTEPIEYIDWDDFGYAWEISVNDETVFSLRSDWEVSPEVVLYQVSESRTYLAIKQRLSTNDDIQDYALYQYANGTLQKVCNFYCDWIDEAHISHYGADIERMTDGRIVLRCRNQFNATANMNWLMEFDYQDDEWTLNSNEYNLDYTDDYLEKGDGMIANQNLSVYTNFLCDEVAYDVAKGDTLILDKIAIVDEGIYFQATNQAGQVGWLKDPEVPYYELNGDYVSGYFEEAMFAG